VDRVLIRSYAKVEIDPSLGILQTVTTNDAVEVTVQFANDANPAACFGVLATQVILGFTKSGVTRQTL